MSYEINISHKGKHLFATHERSCRHPDQMLELLKVFVVKFPKAEGYEISASYDVVSPHEVNVNETVKKDRIVKKPHKIGK